MEQENQDSPALQATNLAEVPQNGETPTPPLSPLLDHRPRMIEIHTRYDFESCVAFYRFTFKPVKFILTISLFFVLIGVIFILLDVLFNDEIHWVAPIFVWVGGLALAFYLAFSTMRNNTKNLVSNKLIGPNTHNIFKFGVDAFFQQQHKGTEFMCNDTWMYHMLHQVIETRDYFFVYTTMNGAHVIPKKDFTVGTPQDLTHLLTTKLGMNFKRVGKF